LVLLTAGGGWLFAKYVNGAIARVDAGVAGPQAGAPLNILLAGVDDRAGLTRHQQALLHVGHPRDDNSDTLMIVHISADRRHAEVVSLPRDSWVPIPGFGMSKINAAIGLGGPKLMVRTVERATGLTISDYVEVNFLGFVKIINALGGVSICVPFRVSDPYTGLQLSAGWHHVNGVTALKYARDRHSFAASDLTRISDQQHLLASLFAAASNSGLLADPGRFARFVSATVAAIRVDEHLNVLALADELRYIRPSEVTFTTVPLANVNYLTPTGQSAVLWNQPEARALFARIGHDQLQHVRGHFRRHGRRPARPRAARLTCGRA
jgi:LCP family protein required for cell wall assembly